MQYLAVQLSAARIINKDLYFVFNHDFKATSSVMYHMIAETIDILL